MTESPLPEHALVHPESFVVEEHDWGRLLWMVNGATGTSGTMTVGQCFIRPGQANPRHRHPNCDEVLYVVEGTVEHTVDDEVFEMTTGDIVSIPRGRTHNARNVGAGTAHFVISFDSPDRQTIGE